MAKRYLEKCIYRNNLIKPYEYLVKVGNASKTFISGQEKEIGKYIDSIWNAEDEDGFFGIYSTAYIYYVYDMRDNAVLYCKYNVVRAEQ